MSSSLPPSKFGAGTTYGESGQAYSLPQAPPSPPAPAPQPAPQSYSVTDPYGTAAHQAPQTGDTYGQMSYTAPASDPYAAPHSAPYPSYPAQGPAGAMPVSPVIGTGGGTAITAAILSLIGALWYGVDTIRNWDKFEFMFQILGNTSVFGMDDGWVYGFLAAAIAQLVFVVLLLVGGVLLLARSSVGRGMAVVGSLLVIAANGYLALAGFQTVSYLNNVADSSGIGRVTRDDIAASILLNTGLPALIAIIALVLLSARSTKLWCRRSTPITY